MYQAKPLVSIIMPAYNTAAYISAAIDSVIRQTYINWELLIIDDGSTDETKTIVFGYHDMRIRYYYQENSGVSVARNKGLAEMKGDFFCFLDADDIFPAESISKRIEYMLSHSQTDMLDGTVEVKDHELKNLIRVYKPSFSGCPFNEYIRLNEKVFFGINLFIRRMQNRQYRFNTEMTHSEDLWFYTQLSYESAVQYNFINEVVYVCRKNGQSAMNNLQRLENGYWQYYNLVRGLKSVNKKQLFYLKCKIVKIMVLSYLSVGKIRYAAGLLGKAFTFQRFKTN
jgi:glycosyltransferase involved in cell wall biosynthesis